MVNELSEDSNMEKPEPVGSPINENTLADNDESDPLSVDEHAISQSVARSLMYSAT